MDGKSFIDKNEMLKSAGIINDYVRKEEDLLKKITDCLKDEFDGTYTSNNYYNLRNSCSRIVNHSNVVVSNNKKITSTFNDIFALYDKGARIGAQKLEDARRDV